MQLPDDYDFETLVIPSVLLALPVATVSVAYGFAISSFLGITVIGVEILVFFLAATNAAIRNRGKATERAVFKEGLPTTALLRAKKVGEDAALEGRREAVMEKTGVILPSFAQAKHSRAKEDVTILKAINQLKERMRDKRFKLLRRELKSYGYFRNMYGIRRVGFLTCIVCALLLLLSFSVLPPTATHEVMTRVFIELLNIVLMLYWALGISKKNLLDAADRYADQFFRSLSLLA